MSVTDSISIFAEGTFEEQIEELVTYFARTKPEDERSAFVSPFQEALRGDVPASEDEPRRKKVFGMVLAEVKSLGDGSDKEIEGVFNLLYAHILTLWPIDGPETKAHVTDLLHVISSAPTSDPSIKHRLLTNLFNSLPRNSPLRLPVYRALLQVASSTGELQSFNGAPADVEKWLSEWQIQPNEKSELWKALADAYAPSAPETGYAYTLAYIRSLPANSPDTQSVAMDAVATALRLPSQFDFDPLFKLDAVVSAKNHELFLLLQIFLNGRLPDFVKWSQDHDATFDKYSLDRSALDHKIRLLTLASLGFKNVGKEVPYSLIASTLHIEEADVEKWVIDVIRAGLLSGKMSQSSQTLRIVRATARTFEREQWELLEQRLAAWKTGLVSVIEIVAAASASQKKLAIGAGATKDVDEKATIAADAAVAANA